MKAIWTRSSEGLRPASDEALRVMAQYQIGEELLLDHKRKRSAKNHRRFFAFVNMTFDWQDQYDNEEIWRGVLEVAAGHFDTVVDKHGNTHFWPKSISWDEMAEDEFRKLFGNVVNAYLARHGKDLNEMQINMVSNF